MTMWERGGGVDKGEIIVHGCANFQRNGRLTSIVLSARDRCSSAFGV